MYRFLNLLFKIKIVKKIVYRFIEYIQANFSNDTSNLYETVAVKLKIGTEKGNFDADKYIKFLNKDLKGKKINFLDIGAADLFMYPGLHNTRCLDKYFAFDINESIMIKGLDYIKNNYDTSNIIIDKGNNFNFIKIPKYSIDIAFCQAVCSHLTLNSQIIMFRNLYSKMKKINSKFYCSYLLFENESLDEPYNYTWLKKQKFDGKDHTVNSFFQKNPYHYNLKTISLISEYCGWKIVKCHDYDHDVQKMIEFKII